MKNRCLGLVISQYLFEGGRNKRVDDVLNLPNFCLFIYKLGLNISFSQAFWEDQIMPGQQITHCWKQRKEREMSNNHGWFPQHDSKVRFILRVKQKKLISLFSRGSGGPCFRVQMKKDEGHLLLFSVFIYCTAWISHQKLVSWGDLNYFSLSPSTPRGLSFLSDPNLEKEMNCNSFSTKQLSWG